MALLWLCYGCRYGCCQPAERLCYACHARQERINVSEVPMAFHVFFQPLSSNLAYPGFNEQCGHFEQQDNLCLELNQQYSMLPKLLQKIFF